MPKRRVILLLAFLGTAGLFFALGQHDIVICSLSEGRYLSGFLAAAFLVLGVYELAMLGCVFRVQARKGAPSEVQMIRALLRAVATLAIVLVFFHFLGQLSGSWAAVAGFAGLLMGWSLQAPVSGLAAWVLVNVKRPFRVGDRVQLPSYGLIGDVRQIGMMYTILNQVGGTVGSEEAAGRDILIPNAMLFGNIIINYTPQQSAAYVLDEVVTRITYNSNWHLAEKILLAAATEVTGDIIQHTGQHPYIRADMYDYGVYMRLRYMTSATDRPRIVYEITKRISDEFRKHTDVDFAIPFVFSHRTGLRAGARHLEPQPDLEAPQLELQIEQITDLTGAAAKPENAKPIAELAQRIAEVGLLQPIVVERRDDGGYVVVAGQLRLAACRRLGWENIPAIIKPPH